MFMVDLVDMTYTFRRKSGIKPVFNKLNNAALHLYTMIIK